MRERFAYFLLIRHHRSNKRIAALSASLLVRLIDSAQSAVCRGNCFILSILLPVKRSSGKRCLAVLFYPGSGVARGSECDAISV